MVRKGDGHTEAVQSNAGIVHEDVDAGGVFRFEKGLEVGDARGGGNVELVVFDVCKAAVAP